MRKKILDNLKDSVGATTLHRDILKSKYLLLKWYEMIYSYIAHNLKPGTVHIELGSGSSLLVEHIPDLIQSNVFYYHENDLAFDASCLPFKSNSVDNLILISVLHHFLNRVFSAVWQ